MSGNNVSVILAHGAWADGSSWSKVIVALQAKGVTTIAAPLPLTTLSGDVDALDQASERVDGQLVIVGHAYAGAVVGSSRNPRVKSLVYVAGLVPAKGETVADVFFRATPHPKAPKLAPDGHALIWRRAGPDDRSEHATVHGRSHEGAGALASGGPHAQRHRTFGCD